METEFTSHRCPMCGGVSHPSNGCAYTPTFVVCEPCVRDFWVWLQRWTASKGRGNRGGRTSSPRPAFFEHVNRVVPGVFTNEQ